MSAVLSDGQGGLLLNTPNGYTPEDLGGYVNTRVAAGDLNHDGLLDTVELSPTYIGVKRGLPNARFAAVQKMANFASDTCSHRVFVADLNRDGWLDIVAIVNAGITVLLNDGTGNMGTATNYGPTGNTQGALLDFNGDGKIDTLSGNGSNLQLMLGDGTGTFTTSTAFATGQAPHAVSMGDFDGDGKPDALITLNGALQMMLRRGNTYTAQPALTAYCSYGPVVVADMDRDGKLDAVVTCTNGNGTLFLYRGLGNGAFAPVATFSVFGYPDSILVAQDMTLDAIPDLVVPLLGGKGIALFVGDGTGGFGYPLYIGDDVHPGEVL